MSRTFQKVSKIMEDAKCGNIKAGVLLYISWHAA